MLILIAINKVSMNNPGGIDMSKVLMVIKGFGASQHRAVAIRIAATMAFALIVTTVLIMASYSNDVNKGLADSLIRLHVIANSDSPEDQALKRDVRDVVLSFMEDELGDSKDIEQTRLMLDTNMEKIEQLAKDEIRRQGKDYDVKTIMGSYPFPTKVYGDITLPAGYYQALRVVIGKGEGQNWWCVLFPPLCFVDATHGTIPDTVKEDLKDVLTKEEYKIVAQADNTEDIPVRVRFKLVEFLESSKIRLSSLLGRIFRP